MITFDDEQVQKQWVEHFEDLTDHRGDPKRSSSIHKCCHDCTTGNYWRSKGMGGS